MGYTDILLTSILINIIKCIMADWLSATDALALLGHAAADALRLRQPGPDQGQARSRDPRRASTAATISRRLAEREPAAAQAGGGGGRSHRLGRAGDADQPVDRR